MNNKMEDYMGGVLIVLGFILILIISSLLTIKYFKYMYWFIIVTYLIYLPIALFVGGYFLIKEKVWISHNNPFIYLFVCITFMFCILFGIDTYRKRKQKTINTHMPYLKYYENEMYNNKFLGAIVVFIPLIFGTFISTTIEFIKIVSKWFNL